ncbi:MAG: hypothetical protein ACHQ51_09110 [Elusimicrobiota bacterium]
MRRFQTMRISIGTIALFLLATAARSNSALDPRRTRDAYLYSEFPEKSIRQEIIPFLLDQLRSPDANRQYEALKDLAYLGSAAAPAVKTLRSLKKSDVLDTRHVDEAIARIEGVAMPAVNGRHIPLIPEVSTRTLRSEEDIAFTQNVHISFVPRKEPTHVGDDAELDFRINVEGPGKYISGYTHRILLAERIERDGSKTQINVPVYTLYRGGLFAIGGQNLPGVTDASHDGFETEQLNSRFILDRPGSYHFLLDAVLTPITSTVPIWSQINANPPVKTATITAEIELLPRDEGASRRRYLQLNAELMGAKDDDMGVDEFELYSLIDYDFIPGIMHLIGVAGGSSSAGTAVRSMAYLCDKKRVHAAVLQDIEKNNRPSGEYEAKDLIQILAMTETIPCRPKESADDVDYVRWDVSRMQWEDRLLKRLKNRSTH